MSSFIRAAIKDATGWLLYEQRNFAPRGSKAGGLRPGACAVGCSSGGPTSRCTLTGQEGLAGSWDRNMQTIEGGLSMCPTCNKVPF